MRGMCFLIRRWGAPDLFVWRLSARSECECESESDKEPSKHVHTKQLFFFLFSNTTSSCSDFSTLSTHTPNQLHSTMGNAVSNFVQKAVEAVKNTVSDMFRSIAPPIVRYVVEHPIRTLGHVGSAALLVAPGIITAPLLAVAGFTGSGVAAGSLAAAVQSGLGTVSAGSTFAVLQSAAVSVDHMVL